MEFARSNQKLHSWLKLQSSYHSKV